MGKNDFWSVVKIYMKPENRVAEINHGEEAYFLKGLSKIVGKEGFVYGIDPFNPYKKSPKMRSLSKLENVELIKSKVPNFYKNLKGLDDILIMDFLFTAYKIPFDETPNVKVLKYLSKLLKKEGNFILNIDRVERGMYKGLYQRTIRENLPNFKRLFNSEDLMVYRKLK